jgi:cell cycle checkpoint protein
MWNSEELESLLHGAGAHKVHLSSNKYNCRFFFGSFDLHNGCFETSISMQIVFNPVTVSSIKKILSRICKQESSGTTEEIVHQIAASSGGDIRHAIMSLQYYCLNPRKLKSALAKNATLLDLKDCGTLAPGQD